MEDYPSPAEGNGLENRQASNIARGFESHILLKKLALNSENVRYKDILFFCLAFKNIKK